MNKFIIIALAIASILITYIGFRLTGLGSVAWLIATTIVGCTLIYPLVWREKLPYQLGESLRKIIHFCMGLVSMLFGLLLLRDLIFLPISLFQPRWAELAFSGAVTLNLICLALVILAYGYWNAKRGPKVVTVQVPIANLHEDFNTLSIVQLSDLHAGPAINQSYIERVVAQVVELQPDIIMLTGDIADGCFARFQHYIDSLKELSNKAPVYYVTGNHEYMKDYGLWTQRFKELGIRVLNNENLSLQHLNQKILIAGVIDPAVKIVDPSEGPNISKALLGASDANLKILLAHQPDIAPKAAAHFDLQLSGHTHAGQFFPWNFFIKLIQKYPSGLKKCQNMWVYVNSGTGYWGPPLRIGTRSEITVIKFTNAQ